MEKITYKVADGVLYATNGKGVKKIVMQLEPDHLHLSLRYLKELGFKGEIVVTQDFLDAPMFKERV